MITMPFNLSVTSLVTMTLLQTLPVEVSHFNSGKRIVKLLGIDFV